jgi:hypothetical protein
MAAPSGLADMVWAFLHHGRALRMIAMSAVPVRVVRSNEKDRTTSMPYGPRMPASESSTAAVGLRNLETNLTLAQDNECGTQAILIIRVITHFAGRFVRASYPFGDALRKRGAGTLRMFNGYKEFCVDINSTRPERRAPTPFATWLSAPTTDGCALGGAITRRLRERTFYTT